MTDLDNTSQEVSQETADIDFGDYNPSTMNTPIIPTTEKEGTVVESKDAPSAEEEDYSKYVEEEARAQGWKPKSEWTGKKGLWKDAQKFLHDGSFIRRIEADKAEKEKLKQIINTVAKNTKLAEERAYKQARADLEYEMQIARNTGNFDAYDRAKEKQVQLQQEYEPRLKEALEVLKEVDVPVYFTTPAFLSFQERNPWYNGSAPEEFAKTQLALKLSEEFVAKNPGSKYDQEKELKFIEDGVKKVFKEVDRKEPQVMDESIEEEEEEKPIKKPSSSVLAPSGGPRNKSTSSRVVGGSLEARMARLDGEDRQFIEYLLNTNQKEFAKSQLAYIEKLKS